MQSQVGFWRRFWSRSGGFGAARSGSTGFRRRFQRLASQHASERFVKHKTLRLPGIPPKLICRSPVSSSLYLATVANVEMTLLLKTHEPSWTPRTIRRTG